MQWKIRAIPYGIAALHALPSILNCYNNNQPKNLNINPMSTYSEVLSQAQNLTPDEQQQLLEVLSALIRDRVTTQTQDSSQRLPRKNLKRWRGFLSKRVDALELQLQLRAEWDE
jgi:hypothetical protein